eukprot:TRINITY_DN9045_c0_g1_i2.p1 TRINITY_DN9045_c0_g1~~TRINITY_DN9045_c0_g1_i2.p1  ORF type:complete len:182 (-),score=3.83 TRINITY_DN9045_c0_g1_i2:56-601(-)
MKAYDVNSESKWNDLIENDIDMYYATELPAYVTIPHYDVSTIFLLAIGPVGTLITLFGLLIIWWFFFTDDNLWISIVVCFLVFVIEIPIYYSVLPQKFEIYDDKLIIHLGYPFRIKVYLDNISNISRNIRPEDKRRKWKLKTSNDRLVYIERKGGWNILISPPYPEEFIDNLYNRKKQTKF